MSDKCLRLVIYTLFERYKEMLADTEDRVYNLCELGLKEIDTLPIDKLSRWIGYVQGYLIHVKKVTSVEIERDFSRPLFEEAYKTEGITTKSCTAVSNNTK